MQVIHSEQRDVPDHPRQYVIRQPVGNDLPLRLCGGSVSSHDDLEAIRIATWRNELAGMYQIERVDSVFYRILALTVDPKFRGNGLGSWLLAHALGLIESSGGRAVEVCPGESSGFFERIGFATESSAKMSLELTPE